MDWLSGLLELKKQDGEAGAQTTGSLIWLRRGFRDGIPSCKERKSPLAFYGCFGSRLTFFRDRGGLAFPRRERGRRGWHASPSAPRETSRIPNVSALINREVPPARMRHFISFERRRAHKMRFRSDSHSNLGVLVDFLSAAFAIKNA